MKKLVLCLAAFFILVNVAGAGEREYYKLEKGAMVFVKVTDAVKYYDLVKENMADDYFNELLNQKLAAQTRYDLIVYKFDKFSYKKEILYRIKIKNGGDIQFVNIQTETASTIKMKNDDIIGWVFEMDLKKIKKSK